MEIGIGWELVVIMTLVAANGFFAAAELAIVAARRGTLEAQAASGDRKAKLAIELANQPDRFLPTVQVGISLIGTCAGVFGGATLVEQLDQVIADSPLAFVREHHENIAMGIVVLSITFLSVVLGELVPKRLALRYANSWARHVARPMSVLSTIARPMAWFLGIATDLVLTLLRARDMKQPGISVEDIHHLLRMGGVEGVLDPVEQKLAMEAIRLGDRDVRAILRPRIDIDAMDVKTPAKEVLGTIAMAGFSRLPVYDEDLDHILGFIHLKDVLRQHYLGWNFDLRKLIRPALFVPATMKIDRLLVLFQEQRAQLAIVLDEFGGTLGLVTLDDVLDELVGNIASDRKLDAKNEIVRRDDGTWLVDGRASIDDVVKALELNGEAETSPRGYSTVAGLVLSRLGRIPSVGEKAQWNDLTLEVVDMDGQRIDRVLISSAPHSSNGST